MGNPIVFHPVAFVRNTRQIPKDDFWGSVISEIELAEELPESAFAGIEEFSHLEILYHFHLSKPEDIVYHARPRGNPAYPEMGIFSQRKRDRPSAIGLCTVQLVEHRGRTIIVRNLDAIDGTPVLDIKPVFREFQPVGTIRQAEWVSDLMKEYWA